MSTYLFEADYRADSLRWMKRIENINFLSSKELDKFQNEIISTNDSALAYFFADKFNYNNYKMQKVIIDNKSAKYALLFAQNIANCDIKALQKLIVKYNNIKYICNFACFVNGANYKYLEKIILKSKEIKYAHMFLKYVEGSNVNKFKNIILASKKPRYLYELSKHLSSKKELKRIEDLIIKSGSFLYMRLFAENIKCANVTKIEQAILDTNNLKEIKKFAKFVKKSKMKQFMLVL